MGTNAEYQYLKSKRGSRYRQLFFGRIRAEVLYRETVGPEPLTPEQVATEYGVPAEAVLEAIDYCVKNKDLLDAERGREDAEIKAAGRDKWPYAPGAMPGAMPTALRGHAGPTADARSGLLA
ncbi:MAG: hypothetical protein U0793_25865 [Gemmataceae bacterium]